MGAALFLDFAEMVIATGGMHDDAGVVPRERLFNAATFALAGKVAAIVIALVLDGLSHPGRGVDLVPTGKIPANLAVSIDWVKFLLDLIPSNIVAVMASGKLLPTLVFSVLFGVAPGRPEAPVVRRLLVGL
jgi:DAACS family dicarboxylate/amino acid:cation (Na+ or H+) symporter